MDVNVQKPRIIFSVHPETPDETIVVSNSEMINFSFWPGKRMKLSLFRAKSEPLTMLAIICASVLLMIPGGKGSQFLDNAPHLFSSPL